MPNIEFHFNAPSLVTYSCRLVRKVQAHGLRSQVLGSDAVLMQLDQALWTFSALDFLPHCSAQATGRMRQASMCLLTPRAVPDWRAPVLINLGEEMPSGLEQFERVLEVVSTDDWHRAQARQRWRQYAASGLSIQQHAVSAS